MVRAASTNRFSVDMTLPDLELCEIENLSASFEDRVMVSIIKIITVSGVIQLNRPLVEPLSHRPYQEISLGEEK